MLAVMDQNCPACGGSGFLHRDSTQGECPLYQHAFDKFVYQMLCGIRSKLDCVSDVTDDHYARGHLTTAYVMVVNLQNMFKPLEPPEEHQLFKSEGQEVPF
jgi:hypothetical protein